MESLIPDEAVIHTIEKDRISFFHNGVWVSFVADRRKIAIYDGKKFRTNYTNLSWRKITKRAQTLMENPSDPILQNVRELIKLNNEKTKLLEQMYKAVVQEKHNGKTNR